MLVLARSNLLALRSNSLRFSARLRSADLVRRSITQILSRMDGQNVDLALEGVKWRTNVYPPGRFTDSL